jgi:hypothetical protein
MRRRVCLTIWIPETEEDSLTKLKHLDAISLLHIFRVVPLCVCADLVLQRRACDMSRHLFGDGDASENDYADYQCNEPCCSESDRQLFPPLKGDFCCDGNENGGND